MGHVAFFRNLNLGQARSKSPTSAVLVSAFVRAGATAVVNFQTNGTVIFEAEDPGEVVARVLPLLAEASGYQDVAIVRPVEWVVDVGEALDPTIPAGEVALFDAAAPIPIGPGWVDPTGSLTVLEIDNRHAVTSWTNPGNGNSANPVLTQLLGVTVTCRGVPTMVRLAARLAAVSG